MQSPSRLCTNDLDSEDLKMHECALKTLLFLCNLIKYIKNNQYINIGYFNFII